MDNLGPEDPTRTNLHGARPAVPPTFESIALDRGYVTPEQVEECREVHRKLAGMAAPSAPGDVFLMKAYLTKEQVAAIETTLGHGAPDAIPGYSILGKVGEGGMGVVYKARQTSMDRIVALKVLLPKFAVDEARRERFVREARAVAKLSHPNVVAGIDAGETNGLYFFAMEYLDGDSMDKVLRARGPLPWREAAAVARQIALALDHAEKYGLVHRDIKPGNIMLLKDGTAKLADLGLARMASAGDTTLTQSGMIVGSPGYVSPEQAMGDVELDIRSDIYSLGLTFFEFLAGARAYPGDNPMTVLNARLSRNVPVDQLAAVGAPPDVIAVIGKMTHRQSAGRYQNPRQLIEDLDAILDVRPPAHATLEFAAPQAPPPSPKGRPLARAAWAAGAVAAALVLAWALRWGRSAAPGAPPAAHPLLALAGAAKLTLLEGIERALGEAGGGAAYHVELERDVDLVVYSVDVAQGDRTTNFLINAVNGKTEGQESQTEDHSAEIQACKAGLAEAVRKALAEEPGAAVEAEMLDNAKGVILVGVVRGSQVVTVYVDAATQNLRLIGEKEVAARREASP